MTHFLIRIALIIMTLNVTNAWALPTDPMSIDQAHLLGDSGALLGIESAWDELVASDVIVAVIDSGVDTQHEDLFDNLWVNDQEIPDNDIDDDNNGYVDDVYGYDFYNNTGNLVDGHGHGTHIAGIIGAVGDNDIGTTGVIWDGEVMNLRFTDDESIGKVSKALEAIDYAVEHGAAVINLSWKVSSSGSSAANLELQEAIIEYAKDGIVFVIAAGNDSEELNLDSDLAKELNQHTIIVGAHNGSGQLASFSNYSASAVHLLAPGSEILSTLPNDDYGYWSGTSQAAPIVAATAALMLTVNPSLSALDIKDHLMNSVNIDSALANKVQSSGTLNIAAALTAAQGKAPQPNVSADWDKQISSPSSKAGGCSVLGTPNEVSKSVVFCVIALMALPGIVARKRTV